MNSNNNPTTGLKHWVYSLGRWFSLDTLLGVVAIQLNLLQPVTWHQWGLIGGLCMATSLCYMIDRCMDAMWGHDSHSHRHRLYANHPIALIASVVILSLIALVFWYHLPTNAQWQLLGLGVGFMVHLACLYLQWYRSLKAIPTALIFTLVMLTIASIPNLPTWGALIFVYALLNLHMHTCMEHRKGHWLTPSQIGTTIGIGGLVLLASYGIQPWITRVFGMGILSHWALFFTESHHWFEWSEVCFAWPFLLVALV